MTTSHPTPSTSLAQEADYPYAIAPSGFRMPGGIALGQVRLQVADLDRSLSFYEGVLGLRLLDRSGADARLGAQGRDDVLVELHEQPGAAPAPRRGRLGLYHFAVLLPSRADLGRFVVHLSRIGARAGASDHLFSEALYLTDPDGLGVEVYADRPKASWPAVNGYLAGDTRPLDLEGLMRAGGDTAWTGMPGGTIIGHVHLYVDDLAQVEAFYHRGLGLDKLRMPFPGALFLAAGGYHHHLGTNTWAASAPRADAEDARMLDWTLILPAEADVGRAARSLTEAGYVVEQTETGVIATDPWGTGMRLVHR